MKFKFLILSFLIFLPNSFLFAGDGGVDKISLTDYWYGAKIDKKALFGKVIVMELWGLN
jgi:hypothetical protein